jgi:hypothetical protein
MGERPLSLAGSLALSSIHVPSTATSSSQVAAAAAAKVLDEVRPPPAAVAEVVVENDSRREVQQPVSGTYTWKNECFFFLNKM